MGKSCVWIPQVRTKTGETTDSKLFIDLLSFTDNKRAQAVKLYSALRSEEFKIKYAKKIKLDDNDEPILSSVLDNVRIKNILDDEVIADSYNRRNDLLDSKGKLKTYTDTASNYVLLQSKCVEFNANSRNNSVPFLMVINKNQDGTISAEIKKTDKDITIAAKNIEFSYRLNQSIRDILSRNGIKIEYLETLQNELAENGVVDYQNARVTAEGFISLIKLADSSIGENALPEEFSHFIIDILNDEGNTLVKRLLNLASDESIQKEVLGELYNPYKEKYSVTDKPSTAMAREVAGKILTRALKGDKTILPNRQSFLERVINAVKDFIRRVFNKEDLTSAINIAEQLASDILYTETKEEKVRTFQLEQLKKFDNLYQLKESSERAKNIVNRSIANALKEQTYYVNNLRARIKKAKTESERNKLNERLDKYLEKTNNYIGQQRKFFDSQQFIEGVENFISDSADELQKVVDRLDKVIKSTTLSNNERAFELTNLKNIVDSREIVYRTVEDLIESAKSDGEVIFSDDTLDRLKTLRSLLSEATSSIYTQALASFGDYLSEYLPEEGVSINSDRTTKKINKEDLRQLLRTAEKDINILDLKIQSLGRSNDLVLQLVDTALKDAKAKKMQRVLKIKKELLALAKELKDAGIKDFSFMFEKNPDGSLSSNYVSTTNWTAFKAAKKNLDKLSQEEKKKWWRENWDFASNKPSAKYNVDIDSFIKPNSLERKFYDYFMNLREDLISYLPQNVLEKDPTKVIMITKDLSERLADSSPSTWIKQVFEAGKDQLFVRADDTEFGSTRAVKSSFDGKDALSLPIFFVKDIEESSISRDAVSTLLAFADMAINYDEMSNVENYYKLGSVVMENRETYVYSRGKKLVEKLTGNTKDFESPIIAKASNISQKYQEFLQSQLYGRYMKQNDILTTKEGVVTDTKLVNVLNKVSVLNQLALNALAGMGAVANDMMNIASEAFAKQYFTSKDLHEADKEYLKELPKMLQEWYNPIKVSKFGLFAEMFDIRNSYNQESRDLQWSKSKFKKVLSMDTLLLFMNMGAHWGELRTASARARAIKVKSLDGSSEISLWDALEVKYIDENDYSKGAKLELKEGYNYDSISKYKASFRELNNTLFGAYNKEDANALQTTAIGQLVFLYRRFIIPSLNRRFGSKNTNLSLGTETEGYYRTLGRVMLDLIKSPANMRATIAMYKDTMTETEKSNITRAINELGVFLAFSILSFILSKADWNDKDNPWTKRLAAYMAKRIKTESGAFTPFGVGGEFWTILKSPFAGLDTIESTIEFTKVLNPFNYEAIGGENAIIQAGRYKGKDKAYKAFMNSPFVPMNKTIYKLFHPEIAEAAFNKQ